MILISHRGNLNGKSDRENQPEYINEALDQGFDVEVDVWSLTRNWQYEFYLGHDEPTYLVKKDFLKRNGLWCHAKNIQGLYSMMEDGIHCFWHQEDDVTLTSRGFFWTYPGKELTESSIAVLPDSRPTVKVKGICSDFIERFI